MKFEKWLQSRLTSHGFSPGPIDGIIGPTTTAAIRAFEEHHDMPVDGKADELVVRALRETSSTLLPGQLQQIPDRDLEVLLESERNVWPRQRDVSTFYGRVGVNQTQIEVPYDMYLAWDRGARLRRMTVHKLVADSALRCLQKVSQIYSAREREDLGLHLFGGSLNVRKMRGGTKYSMHSWGIAIDFDPERNQLAWKSDRARLAESDAEPFWQVWEEEGWLSLGRARNFDWMHVQAARL